MPAGARLAEVVEYGGGCAAAGILDARWLAWLGPAISPLSFEVGDGSGKRSWRTAREQPSWQGARRVSGRPICICWRASWQNWASTRSMAAAAAQSAIRNAIFVPA
jgi:hypothetical protein